MKTKLSIILITIILALTFITPTRARAQTTCLIHTVQTDEWLSKLADKHLGNPLAYPLIVQATNDQLPQAGYATITNPDLIEPGWRLCIPVNPMVEQVPQVTPIDPEQKTLYLQIGIFRITQTGDDLQTCAIGWIIDNLDHKSSLKVECVDGDARDYPFLQEGFELPELPEGPQS